MTTTKKIFLWVVLILLFNILAPLYYWLWMKHRTAFWVCVVLLYAVGFGIIGATFYVMSNGHNNRVATESVMETEVAVVADGEPRAKRSLDNVPTDIRELAQWLCVPYTEDDCVPRMGVTYKDTDSGYFKFRFYITGGKNDTDFGQAQWYIYRRTKGPVTLAMKYVGNSIYQLTDPETGAVAGWMFVDHDGERLFIIDTVKEWECTIVDEELEEDPDGFPEPAPKYKEH